MSLPTDSVGDLDFRDHERRPDGMAVDDAGNLFVATGNGIEVFAPDGGR